MRVRVLLVPGYDVKPVDQLEGTRTLECLQRALQLWQTRRYDLVVVSGGIREPPKVQMKSLAVTMKRWLLAQRNGPQPEQVVVEGQALDIYENVRLALKELAVRFGGEEMEDGRVPVPNLIELTIVTDREQGQKMLLTARHVLTPGLIEIAPVQSCPGLGVRVREELLLRMHRCDPLGLGPLARFNRWLRRRKAGRFKL